MPKKLTVENILLDQLKREMNMDRATYYYLDDWDSIMHSIYQVPIEYAGYTKRVSEMKFIHEMVDRLSKEDFDNVKRSESRKKQMKKIKERQSMYYNLVFTKGNEKIGYGALIVLTDVAEKPERSKGIVLMARITLRDGAQEIEFERAKFDDFLIEVKPYINLLGDLYRESRRP
jgi:hypothetical protein